MRKLIAVEFVSLDGVIQSPGRPDEDASGGFSLGGWAGGRDDPELSAEIRKEMSGSFDLLLGRITYGIWAEYWPLHPEVWPAARVATKYVASDSMRSGQWGPCEILGGDVAARVSGLKRQSGRDLRVYGSARLMETLFVHDLVDELWLKIFPLALGSGKRLFPAGGIPAAFRLVMHAATPTGVIMARYLRMGASADGS